MVRLKTTAAITATTLLFGGGTVLVDEAQNPYFDTGTKLEIVEQSSIPSAGEHRIQAHKDRPAVTLNKWNDEAGFTVAYDKIKANGSRQFLTDRIEWKAAKEELHAYPIEAKEGMEDGGYEIEVYLKEKPDTNVFNFTIEGAEELDFFYQPELTPEEIAEGASRPDNVIGSYAVYHKTKANHRLGDTNYATGKAFHIYRPKAIDANGVETWAELSYSEAVLSVSVPDGWLQNAAYPVRVDPTFGYSTIGGSTSTTAPFCRALINASTRYTASSGDTITSYSHYGSISSGSSPVSFTAYTWNGTLPVTQLAATTSVTITSSTPQWWTTASVSQSLSAGTTYVVALEKISTSVTTYFDLLGGNGFTAHSSLTCLSPWTDAGPGTATYSIYATYTAGAPATTATSSQVFINNSATTIQGAQVIIP